MASPFSLDQAQRYLSWGLAPIPLKPNDKRPALNAWTRYCDTPPTLEELRAWVKKYPQANLGTALGGRVGANRQILAIDVDDDALVEKVKFALPGPGPMKRGAKGLTIFALTSISTTNHKFRRADAHGRPESKPAIEFLCHGSQTVLPPSVHPSGAVYTWLAGESQPLETWPFLGDAELDEITAISRKKDEHFEALNTMVWLGVGGGGTTHDTCVAAVACLVGRSWSDADIQARILRAKTQACARAGVPLDWPQAEATIREWIDSARAKGMAERAATRKPPAERLMAEWALAHLGGLGAVATVQGQLRHYQDGHWPEVDKAELFRGMFEQDPGLKLRDAQSAWSILQAMTDAPTFGETLDVEPRDDPKKRRVCLLNGTLNLRTGQLEPWASEHELRHQLPVAWDDEATCPVYTRVLMQTFDGALFSIQLWDEFCGLTLIDDMTFQKLLFLRGPGGNGKGTLARVLRNLHAASAVGSVAVTSLNSERARTSLIGKLVNISGEQSRLNTVSDTYLKKITGGDPIDVRRLYGELQHNVRLSVRFLELVNEMPVSMDPGYALTRRLIIIDCPNKVREPDPDLDRKLMAERPGILKRVVEAVQRLYTRGTFMMAPASEDAVQGYVTENDPVAYWRADRLEDVQDVWTPSRELYADFKEWYQVMGYGNVPFPEVLWGRRLTAMGFPSHVLRNGAVTVRCRPLRIKPGQETPRF